MSIRVKLEPKWENEESPADLINNEIKSFEEISSITKPQSEFVNIKAEPLSPKTPTEHENIVTDTTLIKVEEPPVLDNNEPLTILQEKLEIKNEISIGTKSIQINDSDISKYKTMDQKYMCPVCEKVIPYKSIFKIHLNSHNKALYCCNNCQKTFKKREIFEKHDCKTYPCTICGKIFKRGSNLSEHRRKEHPEGLFQCDICDKAYTFKRQLEKHRIECVKNIPIICECGELFYSKVKYQSHKEIHKVVKYQCDFCKMFFKHKATLIRHMEVHDAMGNIICRQCNKMFTKYANLKNHLRTHKDTTEYFCPVCDRKLFSKYNVKKHMLRHENPKKLTCTICSKKFPKESRLVYHMRSHTNEKPFQCEFCPKKFTTKQNIARHYKKWHPKNTYESELSEASFAKEIYKEIEGKKRPIIKKKRHENYEKATKGGTEKLEQNTILPVEEVMIKVEPIDYEYKD